MAGLRTNEIGETNIHTKLCGDRAVVARYTFSRDFPASARRACKLIVKKLWQTLLKENVVAGREQCCEKQH